MGAINDAFIHNKISFSKIEEILSMLIKQNSYKTQNVKILQEIGLLKEYSYIKTEKQFEQLINISKKSKIIKNYTKSSKQKSNFVEWTKILFDINDQDCDSVQLLNQKLESLNNKPLNKAFFENNVKKNFKNKSFTKLINYGIPNNFRNLIWDVAIAEKYNNKNYNFEEEKKEYFSILKTAKNNQQIEKDLNRTFIKESEQTKNNFEMLRNLLNFLNKYNDGYCQGMNFIVGFLLKLTNFDEIKTYYILKNILSDIKGLFQNNFPLLKKNISIFDQYFQELYPKLYKHFKNNEIYNELWVGKWLQALFTLSMPFEEVANIWDNLIIKGFNFIIYICLAIINFIEKDLLHLKDSSDILAYLQNILNPKELAFININLLEKENHFIIPLNEVLHKASKIEKKIKENNNDFFVNVERRRSFNNFNKSSLILYKENEQRNNKNIIYDSPCQKASDNSIKHNSSASKSTCSSNNSRLKLLQSPNLINTQKNIDNVKINLCNVKFRLNDNNNNYNSVKEKSKFFSMKNAKTYNLFDNIDLLNNKRSLGFDSNNNVNNLTSAFNISYPLQEKPCIYYNNIYYNNSINNTKIENTAPYANYLIYYG